MGIRLVTLDDLKKHPEFAQRGISINQHYNFSNEEEEISSNEEEIIVPTVNQEQSVPIETVSEKTIEEAVIPKEKIVQPKAKVAAPKKVVPKKAATPKKKK